MVKRSEGSAYRRAPDTALGSGWHLLDHIHTPQTVARVTLKCSPCSTPQAPENPDRAFRHPGPRRHQEGAVSLAGLGRGLHTCVEGSQDGAGRGPAATGAGVRAVCTQLPQPDRPPPCARWRSKCTPKGRPSLSVASWGRPAPPLAGAAKRGCPGHGQRSAGAPHPAR